MRALYTAASGLVSQQTKLDTIANNVSNVNTVGYKAQTAQFAEMLRSHFSQPDEFKLEGRRSDGGSEVNPRLPIGNGIAPALLSRSFAQGNMQSTGNMLDLAIEGEGFFTVGIGEPAAGGEFDPAQIRFTRSGKFQFDATGMLVTDGGYPVLDADRKPILLSPELLGRPLRVNADGELFVQDGTSEIAVGQKINLVVVRNPEANLQGIGENLYQNVNIDNYDPFTSDKSFGADAGRAGTIRQGFLEMSNVDLQQELTDLIQVQRAYQLNARSIQTVDAMMGMANNLRS